MADRLTKLAIDRAAPESKDYFLWDGELKGFGLKVAENPMSANIASEAAGLLLLVD